MFGIVMMLSDLARILNQYQDFESRHLSTATMKQLKLAMTQVSTLICIYHSLQVHFFCAEKVSPHQPVPWRHRQGHERMSRW